MFSQKFVVFPDTYNKFPGSPRPIEFVKSGQKEKNFRREKIQFSIMEAINVSQ